MEVFTTIGIMRSSASKYSIQIIASSITWTIIIHNSSTPACPWRSRWAVTQLCPCTIRGRGGYSNHATSSLNVQVMYFTKLICWGSKQQEWLRGKRQTIRMGYTTQLIRVPFRAFAVSGPSRPEAGGRWVGTKLTHSPRIHKIMQWRRETRNGSVHGHRKYAIFSVQIFNSDNCKH